MTSVVFPIHDQSDHVDGVARGYVRALEAMSTRYELILVTNACNDQSPEICAGLAGAFPSVRHIDILEPGWGRAVKAGLDVAEGDILGYSNAARTTPEMLTLMLAYVLAYPGVVLKANRRVRDSFRRRLGSLIFNLECRAFFDLSVWDINGTPKLFPRAFDRLLTLRENGDLIDLEFNAVCRHEGYPVVEVPILATVRHGGKSTTSYASAVRMYWGAYALWRARFERGLDFSS